MNRLTLSDEELQLALRFVLAGAKGSSRTVTDDDELCAQRLLRKVLDATAGMMNRQPQEATRP
jgi:hypothetical protein